MPTLSISSIIIEYGAIASGALRHSKVDFSTAVFYLIIFNLGSIAGMALLSICIAVPTNHPLLQTGRLRNRLSGVIGISTMSLGAYTIYDMGLSGGVLFGWL